MTWQQDSACRDADPDLFFPVGYGPPFARQIAAAKAVCSQCPVVNKCLDWAIDSGQTEGIWAGMTVVEIRRRMHSRSRQIRIEQERRIAPVTV